jgi:hypothetical protein
MPLVGAVFCFFAVLFRARLVCRVYFGSMYAYIQYTCVYSIRRSACPLVPRLVQHAMAAMHQKQNTICRVVRRTRCRTMQICARRPAGGSALAPACCSSSSGSGSRCGELDGRVLRPMSSPALYVPVYKIHKHIARICAFPAVAQRTKIDCCVLSRPSRAEPLWGVFAYRSRDTAHSSQHPAREFLFIFAFRKEPDG